MPEVVGAFLSTELWHERANCSVEPRNSARGNFAQQGFEFAVRQLDGIEIGRVLRQVAKCRLRFLNGLLDAGHLVGPEVIHHHDVVAPKRWDQACLALGSSVGARAPRLLAAVPRLAGFFLKVMPCRPKKRESALRLVSIRRLSSSASVSFKVRSGRSTIRANIRSACSSNGETLPPRGFGAALRLSFQRSTHLMDELALMSKRSAASRRDIPSTSTASITRSRRSPEYDFGIASPRKGESMHKDSLILNPLGIPSIQIDRDPL